MESVAIQTFTQAQFGSVRIIQEGGKMLFCGSDVAKALGYKNASKALGDHCKSVTKRYTPTNGGEQEMNFITEGDVYRLITHSKLPDAERFEQWVFDEVLPTIRQTGVYVNSGAAEDRVELDPQTLMTVAKCWQRDREELGKYRAAQERQRVLEEASAALAEDMDQYINDVARELDALREKAHLYDLYVAVGENFTLTDTAMLIGVKEQTLFNYLIGHGFLYLKGGKLYPKKEYLDRGLFDVRERGRISTVITPKGRRFLELRATEIKAFDK